MLKTIFGKQLNQEWGIEAKHALAHKDGTWYEYLEGFPGVLFDADGYIVFESNRDYIKCEHIAFGKKVRIPKGISNIPGYTIMLTPEMEVKEKEKE